MSIETADRNFKKSLSLFDLVLFTFCAVFVIDTLAASAAIGPSTITWWIICTIVYFIPYGLISAELGTTYPEQGGLYVWTKKAFGDYPAAMTTWFYWVNVALWMPSVYVLFAGMFAQMFYPEMSLWMQVGIGIFMSWVTVWINIRSLSFAKWIPNAGAIAKILVVTAMIIAAVKHFFEFGSANVIDFSNILPSFDSGLAFLPVIIYNLSGFELMSCAAGEMKNPRRDIPRTVILSGIIIFVFYLLTTVSILWVVPLEELNLVEGLLDTLYKVFGDGGVGSFFVSLLGIAALFTFVANMVTWTLGANRSAAEAAEGGELPRVFGIMHPTLKTPVGSSILTGIVSTVVFIVYGLLATNSEDLFWSIFAFSSIVFLMPYLFLYPAFLILRFKDHVTERVYKVPGPNWFIILISVIAEIFVFQSIILFVWVPGQEIDWVQAWPIIIGTIITTLFGMGITKWSLAKNQGR